MSQEISDLTCKCLLIYESSDILDENCKNSIQNSIEINIQKDSIKRYEYTHLSTDQEKKEYISKEIDFLYQQCGEDYKAFYNRMDELKDENNDIFSSPASIKILGIILLTIFAGIVKGYINSRQNKRSQELATLIQKVKKIDVRSLEMKLKDTFELSAYEGLWQNFTKGNDEERFKLSIYNTAFEIEINGGWYRLYFNDINYIGYKTNSRGRYGAIVDTYLLLDFDNEKLQFSENTDRENAEKFASIFKKMRIRKGNASLHGEKTKAEFNELLVSTFKSLCS